MDVWSEHDERQFSSAALHTGITLYSIYPLRLNRCTQVLGLAMFSHIMQVCHSLSQHSRVHLNSQMLFLAYVESPHIERT
jgi:hypothetical protein